VHLNVAFHRVKHSCRTMHCQNLAALTVHSRSDGTRHLNAIFRVLFQVNGHVIFDVRLPMHYSEISTLTEQEALSLARQHSDFDRLVGNKPILSHQLLTYTESLSVDLHLTVEDDKKKKTFREKRSRAESGRVS